ncbi:hypothetical protein L1887_14716 [Cichorium endivia]|nr:hypothetical protein L1887_14716 [Cichorium endivia]
MLCAYSFSPFPEIDKTQTRNHDYRNREWDNFSKLVQIFHTHTPSACVCMNLRESESLDRDRESGDKREVKNRMGKARSRLTRTLWFAILVEERKPEVTELLAANGGTIG